MPAWLLLVAASLSDVTATLSLRGALDVPALYVLGVAGYVLAFTLLGQVLRRGMSLGVAYGIWGAAGVVLAAAGSALLFGEVLTVLKVTGFVLVAAGVSVVEIGSQCAQQAADGAAASPVAATGAVPAGGEEAR